jgi:thiosulfate/3-mercaptopyruvate sulfurtransferase
LEHIVSPKWLLARLYEPDIVIVDCRFTLGKTTEGEEDYRSERIPGAVYFDLERDLSASKGEHGGRHPLPDVEELALKLGKAGIDPSTRVVAYDDQGGAMASRFWWLLRYMGHEKVYVLDGGYSQWKEAGFPVTSETPPVRVPKRFAVQLQQDMAVGVEEVRQASATGSENGTVLIDSRERPRYLGEMEPIDPVAGHIPGAINRFWKDALTEQGRWKDAQGQRSRFEGLRPEQEVIVYCGSGVTACPNVLALAEAGYRNVKLYVGSWSDWVSYPDNPVATGDEEKV